LVVLLDQVFINVLLEKQEEKRFSLRASYCYAEYYCYHST
jgi:hypothetical protein